MTTKAVSTPAPASSISHLPSAPDPNEFFRQASVRICRHLNIEESLFDCFDYVKRFIPTDKLYVTLFDREAASMRYIAYSSETEFGKLDLVASLPTDASHQMHDVSQTMEWSTDEVVGVKVSNRAEEDPAAKFLSEFVGDPHSSIVGMPLILLNDCIGSVVFVSFGDDKYGDEHVRLIKLLREPFRIALANALRHNKVTELTHALKEENLNLRLEMRANLRHEIIGDQKGLKEVMNLADKVCATSSPVVLTGETGTGKEIFADYIHRNSSRSKRPFVAVNCGAIPDTLIDSELFGHEKGAFTGATSLKRGRFERADGGTLFLDEIGELPLAAQVRLLHVLQRRVIERVGGREPIPVDVRIIAATHRNIEQMIAEGEFRADLWFRLNVFPIAIPPLRDRVEDIPFLLKHIVQKKTAELNFGEIPPLDKNSVQTLMRYNWPGNVRELENTVERALILAPKGPLVFNDLLPTNSTTQAPDNKSENSSSSVLKFDEAMSGHIEKVLKVTKGKISGPGGAAELLGLHPNTLRNKIRRLGIEYDSKSSQ